ncbi:hypothetical protein MTO96_014616 [Rhipicephalus appendiculatus]
MMRRENVTFGECELFRAAGNVPVFLSLLGKRARKSRIKLMMMHLAVADLIVTFVMIPPRGGLAPHGVLGGG